MTETQQSICEWADATFGAPVSDASIAARALVEMAELVTACVGGAQAEKIGTEIADVVIVLARLGRSAGVDTLAMIEEESAPAVFGSARWRSISANLKLAELFEALEDCECDLAIRRLRGLVGRLISLAVRLSINLPGAIDAKMRINRARKWRLDGNGHGQHVEGT